MADDETNPSPAVGLDRVFELEPHGGDVWVGDSPAYPWGRIFGGLVVAQALFAANQTVVDEHMVHSLHGYFILGGDPREPVRYEVTRLRNGRSFSTRQVTARQSGGAIFTMSCSYQRDEGGPETQTAEFPGLAAPTDDTPLGFDGAGIDVVELDAPPARSQTWTKWPTRLADDPGLHACALAYVSDSYAMDAVAASHPDGRPEGDWGDMYMSASLDHAMWFHRPGRVDEWQLLDFEGRGVTGTRGLATGNIFDAAGTHLASIAQEGLIRRVRR